MGTKSPEPLIALRGSKGVSLVYGVPKYYEFEKFQKCEGKNCRAMGFSKDGKLLAWCDGKEVVVASVPSCDIKLVIEKPQTSFICFSPKGNYLALWETYTVLKDSTHGNPNQQIWNISEKKLQHSFIQKKQTNWKPQWTDNEELCARSVNNEVHFFEENYFEKVHKKMYIQKILSFSLSPGASPYHVASYVPGIKGQPSYVTLHCYPNFEGANAVIARKSFYKADKVDFYWNNIGSSIIILASTDVDKSGASYYGEQALYYMATNGDTSMVKLLKDGPIYSVEWSPLSMEFCVVYGSMPAKATVFNKKCEAVFDFGTGPRNAVYYNPLGHMLILAGFGNLRGNVEVWDCKGGQKIVTIKAADSTHLEWSPDGEHILTATTSPRLRIGNGYKIWHYTSSLLHERTFEDDELWDIIWQPFPAGTFVKKPIVSTPVSGIKSVQSEAPTQVYRPPAARGQACSFKLHDSYEPPSDMRAKNNIPQEAGLSKAALKNKKKKEAKKAKKEQEKLQTEEAVEVNPVRSPPLPVSNEIESTVEDQEMMKKVKNITKKLDQIAKLKEQQNAGKTLELNQLEKIKKEKELLEELMSLHV